MNQEARKCSRLNTGWRHGTPRSICCRYMIFGMTSRRFPPDLYPLHRLEESPRIVKRRPYGKVDDDVCIMVEAQQWVTDFAGALPDIRCLIENGLPCRVQRPTRIAVPSRRLSAAPRCAPVAGSMTTACTEPIVSLQPSVPASPRPVCPSFRSASCVAMLTRGCMKSWPPSQLTLPVAWVTDRRGASMACCVVMPWSMRLSVTLSTELMMVAPPGEPKAATGWPSFSSSSGAMLERGRL